MFATLALTITLAAATTAAGTAPGPATLQRSEADSIRRAIEKDREETRTWLKTAPNSYLATVQRVEFLFKTTLTVGRGGGDVRLEDPAIRPTHLTVTVLGDSFKVQAIDDSASFKVKGAEVREAVVGPSAIEVGRYTLRLSHQRYPAIIVFDPQSPRYQAYKGIEYYPVDLKWRYVLPLTPNARADTMVIASTRGYQRRAVLAGWFDFMAGGTKCRLEAHRLLEPGVGESDIAVFFRDATTGKDTYSVGRYIDPVRLPGGEFVLDFNTAYNPACAYSEHYNCPIPPRRNRLAMEVRAGEKDSHYLEHTAP
ncbi:MAG TPA: DUF1684 domain-containing protein [Candidatus Eisenbacteria bacterium]|nr:DUF1684 domain-containing protein [Candidatus Eisenbacteria bacterium]